MTITIDEAIKILRDYEQELMLCLPTDKRAAIELGIEALKRVNEDRVGTFIIRLPGETEQ